MNYNLQELFKKYRTVGIVGNADEAKTSIVLTELINIRAKFDIEVYCFGISESLEPYLTSKGIKILRSKNDILDMKIKNSVIFIDEFGDLFSTQTRDKELTKVIRFFNRIAHLNDFVIISSARENFWNKFMCGIVKAFYVKKVEFNSLVNGTDLKSKVMALENSSDYRLDIPKNTYYIIDDNEIAKKCTFEYNPKFDSKQENKNPFADKKVNEKEKK